MGVISVLISGQILLIYIPVYVGEGQGTVAFPIFHPQRACQYIWHIYWCNNLTGCRFGLCLKYQNGKLFSKFWLLILSLWRMIKCKVSMRNPVSTGEKNSHNGAHFCLKLFLKFNVYCARIIHFFVKILHSNWYQLWQQSIWESNIFFKTSDFWISFTWTAGRFNHTICRKSFTRYFMLTTC